jgi:hypothetical protein
MRRATARQAQRSDALLREGLGLKAAALAASTYDWIREMDRRRREADRLRTAPQMGRAADLGNGGPYYARGCGWVWEGPRAVGGVELLQCTPLRPTNCTHIRTLHFCWQIQSKRNLEPMRIVS